MSCFQRCELVLGVLYLSWRDGIGDLRMPSGLILTLNWLSDYQNEASAGHQFQLTIPLTNCRNEAQTTGRRPAVHEDARS